MDFLPKHDFSGVFLVRPKGFQPFASIGPVL